MCADDPILAPGQTIPALAASYAAHWIATTFFPTGQQQNNPNFDAIVRGHIFAIAGGFSGSGNVQQPAISAAAYGTGGAAADVSSNYVGLGGALGATVGNYYNSGVGPIVNSTANAAYQTFGSSIKSAVAGPAISVVNGLPVGVPDTTYPWANQVVYPGALSAGQNWALPLGVNTSDGTANTAYKVLQTNSQTVGVYVAKVLIYARANDGFQAYKYYTVPQYPPSNAENPIPTLGYTGTGSTGSYTATVKLPIEPRGTQTSAKQGFALYPQYQSVTPYVILQTKDWLFGAVGKSLINSVNNTAGGPPAVGTAAFENALAEVRDRGSDGFNHTDPVTGTNQVWPSTRVSQYDKDTPFWWKLGSGTSQVSGFLTLVSLQALNQLTPNAQLWDYARLITLVNVAMFDAMAAGWYNKFQLRRGMVGLGYLLFSTFFCLSSSYVY